MKQILLVGVDPQSGNRGVGALAYSTLYIINKISEDKNIPLSITILCEGIIDIVRKEEIIDINGKKIKVKYIGLIIKRGFFGKIATYMSVFFQFKKLLSFDYIMDMGAGDSYSDIYGSDVFYKKNFPKILFRILKKKLMFLPQTIGPFKNVTIKKAANRSIEKSLLVLTRDKISYDYVINETIQKKAYELTDVAFFMPYLSNTFDSNYIHVGLNISALIWNGGYTRNNQFGLQFDYKSLIRDVIEYFIETPNVKLHLIPHVVSSISNIENDYEICRLLENEYKTNQVITSPFFLTPIEAKNYISGLDFFTGARMHACIAAFSSGVPVYPMAYSRKFNGLFKETIHYNYLGDMINQSRKDFFEGMLFVFENREIIKKDIIKKMENIKSKYYITIESEIKKFIDL